MRLIALISVMMTCLPNAVWPETAACDGTGITVVSRQPAYTDLVCDAVEKAQNVFAGCGLPAPRGSLMIEVVNELSPGCVALYHCGKEWIEVLEPPLMQARRSPKDAFAFLSIESYFQSVIVHELAHKAFDKAPCPFGSCIASDEYFAFVMQIMSLTPAQRDEFSQKSDVDGRVSREELSAMLLFMSPSLFARKAWAHVSQRDDPCAYLGQIIDGAIVLDKERF